MQDAWIIERTHGGAPPACPYFVNVDGGEEEWTGDIEKAQRFEPATQAHKRDCETLAAMLDPAATYEVILHKPR